jgi:hypothetical protein
MQLPSNCDRYDVDILYVLESHGWSNCILYIGDTIHSIDSISHAFGDPMGDLVIATISGSTHSWHGIDGDNQRSIDL